MSRWHKHEYDFYPEHAFQPRATGGMTLEGGGGGGGASAAQMLTAQEQAKLSREQLDWAKSIYYAEAPERAEANALAKEVSQAQLEQMREQTATSKQARDDYNNTFRPLEQSLVKDAQEHDTPERRAAEAAAGSADVETQISAQRAVTAREMERAGVNPASGRSIALQGSMDLGAAKAKAGAANSAAKAVEQIGYARKMDAASLGRGIASSQGTSAALAMQQGQGAIAASQGALAANQSGNNFMSNAYSSALSGLSGAGSAYGSVAAGNRADAAARNSNVAAGVGAVASIAAVAI